MPAPPQLEVQPEQLPALLHRVFGHRDFRPHQQLVCEAAAAGRDVLLVMPTGAGKSLCYQLPALARGGTALVISPLIALMDDQASKLSALNLKVARIHSGLSRDDARNACRDYLAGDLDFLFIAPERMRVPGFPAMLARRKPTLVAIDEAHCISAWGHDFRPDYRTLGQHLPALRPAPIIALTATATPTVQRDIAHQLNLQNPATFITGFRRSNLAIEVVELSKPRRPDFALKLLQSKEARPAILYAQSRKDAEEYAAKLHKHFPTAAYHAGLDAQTRDRVQRAFLSGKLDVIVATVAFGMGVDKADVRTVIHVALPGSVESYYQEIGRAGRDGLPSRTVLLHGFADRRLQEFFLEKNYPPVNDLERVAKALPTDFTPIDILHNLLRKKRDMIDRETLDRTIEKLLVAGVVDMDITGDVRLAPATNTETKPTPNAGAPRLDSETWVSTNPPGAQRLVGDRLQPVHKQFQNEGALAPEGIRWQAAYESQISVRRAQIDRMIAFAESTTCRMAALVHHFGDTTDKAPTCGLCDICNPSGQGSANAAHQPTEQEKKWLRQILSALESRSTSTGKLFTDLALTKDRNDFDTLLDALARAALITLTNDTFRTPEGVDRTYKKAAITHEGRDPNDATLDTVYIRGNLATAPTKKKSSIPVSRESGDNQVPRGFSLGSHIQGEGSGVLTPEAQALFTQLRNWRTETARPTKTPAFLILSDAVLRAIATRAPQNLTTLSTISGIGPSKVDKYGADLIAICRGTFIPSEKPVAPTKPDRLPVTLSPPPPQEGRRPDRYQPRAKPEDTAAKEPQRAGGPTYTPATKEAPQGFSLGSHAASGGREPLASARPQTSAVHENKRPGTPPPPPPLTDIQIDLEDRLKQWRREEARTAGLPSFFILSDTVLRNIVLSAPHSTETLRTIQGLTSEKLDRFGPAVLTLCTA
jgi:ATP-dependent DNA helicase RecQ